MPRRVRRDHGPLGLGQVDPDEHAGLPGPADRPAATGSTGPTSRPWATTRWRRSGCASWASSSRASTCWPGPARSRTSACRCSTPGCRPASATRWRPSGCARWAWATGSTTSPASSPAASSSGSPSPARWSTTRPSCWPTSRPATSTPRPARRSWASSATSTPAGRTIIMVTHDEDVAGHAKRIVRVKDGRIVDDRSSRRERLGEPPCDRLETGKKTVPGPLPPAHRAGRAAHSPSEQEHWNIVKSRSIFGTAVVGLIGAIIGSFSMMLYASTHFAGVAGPGNNAAVRQRRPAHHRRHHRPGPDHQRRQARRALRGRARGRPSTGRAWSRPTRSRSSSAAAAAGHAPAGRGAGLGLGLRLLARRPDPHQRPRRAQGHLVGHRRLQQRRPGQGPRLRLQPRRRPRAGEGRRLRQAAAPGRVRRQHPLAGRPVGDRDRRAARAQALGLGRRRLGLQPRRADPGRRAAGPASSRACSRPRPRSTPATRAARWSTTTAG